ncbi:PREDICTED: la-related protein 1B-like [Erythranthe guttata]|uniref:la-related protein 1B-like n=1 Tax=Erythranthe guttata TaxID=4155 RepID=UPI00064D7398|nr:PREDICTED: la-related protein 1B-like [Erythranthe guttata]|eukprot:XP_012828817.1 PREDICTED: la-related protein 1B-like [Erythranthe guttata]
MATTATVNIVVKPPPSSIPCFGSLTKEIRAQIEEIQSDCGLKEPPAWNKPSDVVGVAAPEVAAPVMGDVFWPDLSESLKSLPHGSITITKPEGMAAGSPSSKKEEDGTTSASAPNSVKQRSGGSNQSSKQANNGSLYQPPPPPAQGISVGPALLLLFLNEAMESNTEELGRPLSVDHHLQLRLSFHLRRPLLLLVPDPLLTPWFIKVNLLFFYGKFDFIDVVLFADVLMHLADVPPPPPPPPHFYYVSGGPPPRQDFFRPMPMRMPMLPFPPMFFPVQKPGVSSQILKQIEYYFSNDNLVKDIFLRQNMDAEGWVPIKLIAGFRKVMQLTDNIQLIKDSMQPSNVVEVQADKLRRRNDWSKWIILST